MTLAEGHISVVCKHFQRASPIKQLGQFHLNFICSLLAKGKRVYIVGPAPMIKTTAMHINGKILKKKFCFSRTTEPIALHLVS